LAFAWSRSMAPHNRQIFLILSPIARFDTHLEALNYPFDVPSDGRDISPPIALKKMAKASHTRSASHRVDSKLSIGSRDQPRSIQRRVEISVPRTMPLVHPLWQRN
jgi:hypothetical protein